MKKELGVDSLPLEHLSETVFLDVPANSQAAYVPFPSRSGQRMRRLVGVKTYTNADVSALPPSLIVNPVDGATVLFTLRATNGEYLVRDMPYLAFRSVEVAGPGLRQKVLDRLPVDWDKSWVRVGFAAGHRLVFEFIYGRP